MLSSKYPSLHHLILFLSYTDIIVSPPFVYITQVKESLMAPIQISAQNSWVSKGGAFTGEIRWT